MDFIIEEDFAAAPAQERDIVPAGTHRMVIRSAEEGPNEYKTSETNPEGQCLKLRLATVDGNYKFVFDDLPKHLGWRAANLADALGIKPVGERLTLTPDDCREQIVTVEISHYTSKAGKTSAVVKRYVPATVADKAKPAAPRSRAAVAVAASDVPADEIPF